MRIGIKLASALVFALLLVEVVFALVRYQREVAFFDAELRLQHRSMGVTLARAVAGAMKGGRSDAMAMVERVNQSKGELRIRWVEFGAKSPATRPLLPAHRLTGLVPEQPRHLEVRGEEIGQAGTGRHLLTYVEAPLVLEHPGAIEIEASLAARDAHLRSTMITKLVEALVIALVCGGLGTVISINLVGQPAQELSRVAERMGEGALETRARLLRDDELGDLGRRLNTMAQHLAEARERAEREAEDRVQAVEQLRHADRLTTLGKLASSLAHELGTPLNVISGHAQLLSRGKLKGDAVPMSAQTIVEQGIRMTSLVEQILGYARRQAPSKDRVDIAEVVDDTLELMRPLARKRGVALIDEVERPCHGVVDSSQVRQVLTNLVTNAVQASAEGRSVMVTLALEGEHVLLAVRDEGPGISDEVLPQIYEPFFTTKPSGEGTGLGLSITQGIVEEHGGRIDLTTGPGGTHFRVHLPTTGNDPETSDPEDGQQA